MAIDLTLPILNSLESTLDNHSLTSQIALSLFEAGRRLLEVAHLLNDGFLVPTAAAGVVAGDATGG